MGKYKQIKYLTKSDHQHYMMPSYNWAVTDGNSIKAQAKDRNEYFFMDAHMATKLGEDVQTIYYRETQ